MQRKVSSKLVEQIGLFGRRHLSKKIVYEKHGNPSEVLNLVEESIGPDVPGPGQVLVRWLASPVNPADINQIQGVYPVKPPLPAIGGNEGCALIEKVGAGINNFKEGDLALPANAGLGTWRTHGAYEANQLFPIDRSFVLNTVAASMLQVNPPTAYRMLNDFLQLSPGDIVVQNGGNSAVGRFVIQICRIKGLKSISIVRDRPDINELKEELKALGADEVFTEEEFSKELRNKIGAKLALNCVGGKSSLNLIRALGDCGCMVTYGGMSKNPVQVPTSSLIFNDVTLRGFWMSRWYDKHTFSEERKRMYAAIADWYKDGLLHTPPFQKRKLENFEEAVKEATESSKFKQIFMNE